MQLGYSIIDNRRIIMPEIQNCCNKPQKAEKFLKICLLTLLYDQKAHGYFLIEELAHFIEIFGKWKQKNWFFHLGKKVKAAQEKESIQ
jgi:DNA-binding PadR family transcriptional regulator